MEPGFKTIFEPLSLGEVHLWLVNLAVPADTLAALRELLSEEERARADRLFTQDASRRFIAGRAALRKLVGRYSGIHPASVKFETSAHGKLSLPGSRLSFNLSHSGELALMAFTLDAPLGIDLEQIHPVAEIEAIARGYFSTSEREALFSLPEAERQAAFFRTWTRKEAYLKARGEGMALPLDHFSVSLLPGEAPRLLEVENELDEPGRWTFCQLEPRPGFTGALVIEGSQRQLRWYQLE